MSVGTHIAGWMTLAELNWLHATAGGMASVAEVGSHRGRSSYALLSACTGPVWCVDSWEPDYGYGDEPASAYDDFMLNCGGFPNLRVVRGTSPGAAAEVPTVEMVFIDGDHSYEAVKADLEAWTPKVSKLICGHDYGNPYLWQGVTRAVHEAFAAVENPVDNIWAVTL